MTEDECKSKFSVENFFKGYDRRIILCYALISLIINLYIVISIYFAKNKKISIVIKLSASILSANFINIFAYTFEWVICNDKSKKYDGYFKIGLLFGNSKYNKTCQLQSFLLLSSSMCQDYLMILFFYMVNRGKIIKELYINLLIFLSIIFPIIISIFCLNLGIFGVNDDFCYLQKYHKSSNNIIDLYTYNDYIRVFTFIIFFIRLMNFSVTMYFLVNIIKYIKNENKSFRYTFKRLLLFFVQLFKLFIIIIYRAINSIYDLGQYRKIYRILSTVDGILMPLTYALTNGIFCNLFKSKYDDENEEDYIFPKSPEIKYEKTKKRKILNEIDISKNKSNFIGSDVYNDMNNFDLSF